MKKTILFIRDIFWFSSYLHEDENDEYQVYLFNMKIRYFLFVFLPFLIIGTYLLFKKILSLFNAKLQDLHPYFIFISFFVIWPYLSCFPLFKHFKKWLEKYPVNEKNNFENVINEIFGFIIIVGSGFLLVLSPFIFSKIGKLIDLVISKIN